MNFQDRRSIFGSKCSFNDINKAIRADNNLNEGIYGAGASIFRDSNIRWDCHPDNLVPNLPKSQPPKMQESKAPLPKK